MNDFQCFTIYKDTSMQVLAEQDLLGQLYRINLQRYSKSLPIITYFCRGGTNKSSFIPWTYLNYFAKLFGQGPFLEKVKKMYILANPPHHQFMCVMNAINGTAWLMEMECNDTSHARNVCLCHDLILLHNQVYGNIYLLGHSPASVQCFFMAARD